VFRSPREAIALSRAYLASCS